MPTIVYPSAFWTPGGPQTFHTAAGGAWVPSTATTARQVGVTFFTRAPQFFDNDTFFEAEGGVPWRDGDQLSVPPATLQDLIRDPSWSLPWFNGGRLHTAATLPYLVDSTGPGVYRILVVNPELEDDDDHYQDFSVDPVTAPTQAMAFWIDGTIGSLTTPLVAIIRFDEPLLLQSSAALPAFVSAHTGLVSYKYESGATYDSMPSVGAIGVRVPALEWESARAAHVWMKPQRTNLVANPSFEFSPYPYSGGYAGEDPHRMVPESDYTFESRLWGWRSNANVFEATDEKAVGPPPREWSAHLVRDAEEEEV